VVEPRTIFQSSGERTRNFAKPKTWLPADSQPEIEKKAFLGTGSAKKRVAGEYGQPRKNGKRGKGKEKENQINGERVECS